MIIPMETMSFGAALVIYLAFMFMGALVAAFVGFLVAQWLMRKDKDEAKKVGWLASIIAAIFGGTW